MRQPTVSKNMIRRLRLREGDILLVKDEETMRQLVQATMTKRPSGILVPKFPIIVAPHGVHRLSREYLLKLVNTEPQGTNVKFGDASSTS